MIKISICVGMLAVLTGCSPQERPEATAYRKQVETLQIQNRELQQQADVADQMLNITATALVITGCGLGVTLFVLMWIHRKRRS